MELRDYHASLKPQTHTSKLLQESFNPGETHYEENLSNTATQKARLAADSRIGLAGSQIGATKNSSSNEKLPSFYETPALRILVVDDEPDVVASFKFSFEDAGYKVDGFTDPLIALSKFKANIYDIVLLDIRMPELDGIELYERMMRINNKVLVFFVTAYEIYKEALERLFPDLSKDFLIRKPVEMNDLVRMVTTVCESLR